MDIEHLESILKQVFIMHPNVYISNFNYTIYKKLHKINTFNTYEISDTLHHVAKSPDYHKDFYESIIIPNYGGHCYAETWIRGHEYYTTDVCKMVKAIYWTSDISYTYTHDHSKYCYSDKGWIMIGDLNRMTSQEKRGGGGLVIHDVSTTRLFKEIIVF